MHGKWTMLCSSAALLCLAVSGQAQFFNLGKGSIKNNVTRAVAKTDRLIIPQNVIKLRVPTHVLPAGETLVHAVTIPSQANAVNASLLYMAQEANQQAIRQHKAISKTKAVADYTLQRWQDVTRQAAYPGFYENQAALAQDINAFYKGSGVAVQGANGQLLKLYELPVDGLVYQSGGKPRVLRADETFVVYDVKQQTGQLVQKDAGTVAYFSSRKPANSGTFDELVVLEGKEFLMPQGEPDWALLKQTSHPDFHPANVKLGEDASWKDIAQEYGRLATEEEEKILMQMNQQSLAQEPMGRLASAEEIYYLNKQMYAKDDISKEAALLVWHQGHYPSFFRSPAELAEYLTRFHRGVMPSVKDSFTGIIYQVYEIPVDGLEYAQGSRFRNLLDPQTMVLLVSPTDGAQLVERSVVEKQKLFTFVD